MHSDPDECALNAGQSKALILKLTPVDVKTSKGAERGNAREISGGASEELVDRFCLVGATRRGDVIEVGGVRKAVVP